jgi:hypothetical protein
MIIPLYSVTAQCPTANAGPDKTICPGSTTSIGLNSVNNSFSFAWSPPSGLSSPNSPVTNASPSSTTTYTLTISPKNLIINGDFNSGNTGFITDYTTYGGYGSYWIGTSPSWVNNAWCSISGTNNIMFFDGMNNNTSARVWSQTVNVAPNTNYIFSFRVLNIALSYPEIPNLQIKINGISIGNQMISPTSCQWQIPMNFTWSSGSNTTAQIAIYDLTQVTSQGNDFAIDDLSFKANCTNSADNVKVTVKQKPVINNTATLNLNYVYSTVNISNPQPYIQCYFWEPVHTFEIKTTNNQAYTWYVNGNEISFNNTYYYLNNNQTFIATDKYAIENNTILDYFNQSVEYKAKDNTCNSFSNPISIKWVPKYDTRYGNYCQGISYKIYFVEYGSGSQYIWNPPPGVTITPINTTGSIIKFSSSITGIIPISVSVDNPYCPYNFIFQPTVSSSCKMSISSTENSAIESNENISNEISLYPNPAQNVININSRNENIRTICIYTLNGILVKKFDEKFLLNKVAINISEIKNGMYVLKVITNKNNYCQKIFVSK